MISKSAMRELGWKRRAALSELERARFDEAIMALCRDNLNWAQYRKVMVFLPIERQHEVDTWPLVRWIWERWPKIHVYAPRVAREELELVGILPETLFTENYWGVPEPSGAAESVETLDLVLTPLLGFDKHGHRVGYGRGYYDRFFAAHSEASRAGLGYECLFSSEDFDAEAHDIRLQAVITEEQVREFGR